MGRLTLCLDTATLIDLIRGRSPNVRENYSAAVQSGREFAVPCVVMHELFSGIATSYNPTLHRARMEEALIGLPVVDLTAEDMKTTGKLAGDLRASGRPIGDMDTLIAGQALARGWTVVTSNIRHFGRVEGLPLIDWSVGADPLATEIITERVEGGAGIKA